MKDFSGLAERLTLAIFLLGLVGHAVADEAGGGVHGVEALPEWVGSGSCPLSDEEAVPCSLGYGWGDDPVIRYLSAVHSGTVSLAMAKRVRVKATEELQGEPGREGPTSPKQVALRTMTTVDEQVTPRVVAMTPFDSDEVNVGVAGVDSVGKDWSAVGYGIGPGPVVYEEEDPKAHAEGRIAATATALWLLAASESGARVEGFLAQDLQQSVGANPGEIGGPQEASESNRVLVAHTFGGGEVRLHSVSRASGVQKIGSGVGEVSGTQTFRHVIELVIKGDGAPMIFDVVNGVVALPSGMSATTALGILEGGLSKAGVRMMSVSRVGVHCLSPLYRAELVLDEKAKVP